MTQKMLIHLQTPAPGHSLHHCWRTKIPSLKSHQLVVDGGYYFQSDARNNLPNIPCNKPSLLCSNVYLPKSDISSGNIISVAVCCILFDHYSANGDHPKKGYRGLVHRTSQFLSMQSSLSCLGDVSP